MMHISECFSGLFHILTYKNNFSYFLMILLYFMRWFVTALTVRPLISFYGDQFFQKTHRVVQAIDRKCLVAQTLALLGGRLKNFTWAITGKQSGWNVKSHDVIPTSIQIHKAHQGQHQKHYSTICPESTILIICIILILNVYLNYCKAESFNGPRSSHEVLHQRY